MADLHYGMIWQNLAEPGIVWQNLAALANSGSPNQPVIDLEMGQISSGDKSNLVTSDVKLVRRLFLTHFWFETFEQKSYITEMV